MWMVVAVSLIPTSAVGQDIRPILTSYGVGEEEPTRHLLARPLREISGLALTDDGRLFAHDDERAFIYQLRPQTGEIVKSFRAGWLGAFGDFEGIAITGERFFLVTSDGSIIEFKEGEPSARVGYEVFPTGLGERCEVEGLAHDRLTDSLLLACKTTRTQALAGYLAIFALSLETMSLEESPRS